MAKSEKQVMLYMKRLLTDAFSASPVGCKNRAWCLLASPPAIGVFSVSKSGETYQVINDVMKS